MSPRVGQLPAYIKATTAGLQRVQSEGMLVFRPTPPPPPPVDNDANCRQVCQQQQQRDAPKPPAASHNSAPRAAEYTAEMTVVSCVALMSFVTGAMVMAIVWFVHVKFEPHARLQREIGKQQQLRQQAAIAVDVDSADHFAHLLCSNSQSSSASTASDPHQCPVTSPPPRDPHRQSQRT